METLVSNPQSTAKIAGHPLHPMLVPFPIAFFAGTLAADLAYGKTGDAFWFLATEWLLGAGIVMALLAAVAGFTDFLGDQRIRRPGWKDVRESTTRDGGCYPTIGEYQPASKPVKAKSR